MLSPVPHLVLEVGQPVHHDLATTIPSERLIWEADPDLLPEGLSFEAGTLRGTPVRPGEFRLAVSVALGDPGPRSRSDLIGERVGGAVSPPLTFVCPR